MGNPFQDQLLKAGLVNKKQAKKAKLEQHRSRKQQKKKNHPEVMSSSKARDEQAAQEKRNRELNQQRTEEARQREQEAQVKQLILNNRLELNDRGDPYNFVEQNKIKRIFVSEEIIDQLSRGQLAIVKLGDGYEVVPAKVARQIVSRIRDAVVVFHVGESLGEASNE